MKSTRKIIPALVMLLVSAIMLSTASYAWFASNTEVTASNMTVQANTDVVFLQITTDKDDEASWAKSVPAANTESGELKLVTADIADGTTVTWKTAEGSDPTKYDPATGDDSVADYTTVETISTDYALINTFYVRMSNNTSTLENLTISEVVIAEGTPADGNFNESIRVLVIAKDESGDVLGAQCWDVVDGLTDDSADQLADVVNNTPITLEVYIYYDGDDTAAFTNNNLSTVTEQTISVSFTADEVSAP